MLINPILEQHVGGGVERRCYAVGKPKPYGVICCSGHYCFVDG